MSVMGRFAKLDSSLQRGLDNGFAFVFGGKVVPAEIEELLKQEAEDNVVHTYEGFVEVPNEFRVAVSPKDFKNLSSQAPTLPGDFADRLSRFFRNQRWVAAGPVVVEIFSEQGLRTGQLKAESARMLVPSWYQVLKALTPRRQGIRSRAMSRGRLRSGVRKHGVVTRSLSTRNSLRRHRTRRHRVSTSRRQLLLPRPQHPIGRARMSTQRRWLWLREVCTVPPRRTPL